MVKRISFRQFVTRWKQYVQDRMLPEEMDAVILVIGGEGSGKSLFTLGVGALSEPDFSVDDQFHFTLPEYLESQLQVSEGALPPGHALFLDEGGSLLFARSAMDRLNKATIQMYIMNRALQIQHWICVPRIESIDKYLRDNRAHMLIHVWKKRNKKGKLRRYAAVFSRKRLARMMQTRGYNYWFHDEERQLIPRGRPNLVVHIPDLTHIIPPSVIKAYKEKKTRNMRKSINAVLDMTRAELEKAQEAARVRAESHAPASGVSGYSMRSPQDRPRAAVDQVEDQVQEDVPDQDDTIPTRDAPEHMGCKRPQIRTVTQSMRQTRPPGDGPLCVRITRMAGILHVSDTYLRRMCREDQVVGATKYGKIWYVPVEQVPDALLRFGLRYDCLEAALVELHVPGPMIKELMEAEA